MDKIIVKVTKGFVFLVMIATSILTVYIVAYSKELLTDSALADKILNPIFAIGFLLLGLGLLFTMIFGIGNMISHPKMAIRTLISLALFGLLFLISYMGSSDSIDAKVYQDFNISNMESKLIGSLIVLSYILGGLSVAAMLFSGVYKFILRR
jgi:hypothetical protein